MKERVKREGPLKIALPFESAIKLALDVKPPPEGWAALDRNLKSVRKRQRGKKSAKG